MKRVFLTSVLLVMGMAVVSLGQLRPGRVELSTAASIQVFLDEGESFTLVNIPLRVGVFVTPSLSLEPEVIFTFVEDADAAYLLSGNLAYHFPALGKSNLFALGGVGYANAVPFHNSANSIAGGFEDLSAVFLNAGLGNKLFLSNSAALRIEFRFQNFWWDSDFGSDSEQYLNGFIGFSVFVP